MTRLPVTAAEWYPPGGRRTLGVVLVKNCPYCRNLHVHRAASARSADGSARIGSCGSAYKLRLRLPAQRLEAAA